MGYQAERQSIESYFQTNWTHTPIQFDNNSIDLSSVNEWVRLVIVNGDAFRASLGVNHRRITGSVIVSIFTKKDTGSNRSTELSDIVDTLFNELVLSNLRFWTPSRVVVSTSLEWYQANVACDFYRDEFN